MSAAQGNANTGKEDYVDKAMDMVEKKLGKDPNSMRSTNEKITDKGRALFEKATGKKVSEKISN